MFNPYFDPYKPRRYRGQYKKFTCIDGPLHNTTHLFDENLGGTIVFTLKGQTGHYEKQYEDCAVYRWVKISTSNLT